MMNGNERIDRVLKRLNIEGFDTAVIEENPLRIVVYPRNNPDAGSVILEEWRGCVTPTSFEGEFDNPKKKEFFRKHIEELCTI